MSQLKARVDQAHQVRRRRLLLGIGTVLPLILIVVAGYLSVTYLDYLNIIVAPDEVADTAEIEIIEGRGVVLQKRIVAVREHLKFRITANGFVPEELTVADSTWRRGQVDVVLRPLPAELSARTSPVLPNVRWYLDEVFISEAAELSEKLPEGEYTLSAMHPYFEPASHDVALERGRSNLVNLVLEPIKGSFEVTSEPVGASVLLNSTEVGNTPLKLNVPGGEHEVSVRLAHHLTRTESIEITANKPKVKKHYELAVTKQNVTFSLNPQNGLLTVDFLAVPTQPVASVSLPTNSTHIAQYSKPGYRAQEIEFTVNPDIDNRIDFELKPVYGQVEVMSEPTADVLIGGKVIGETPLQFRLQTIPQTITVSQTGYVSESRTITPDEGSTEVMYVTLVSVEEHRLNTAPSTYVNSIGIELKLFKQLKSFRMGSSSGETGRRPNEFARQIELRRPFYAGIYEVTVDQYQQFSSPGSPPSGNQLPITGVSWLEAARFCNWLSTKEGLKPVYQFQNGLLVSSDASADGYRMLTEPEWEWLARKAGRSEQSIFPWGNVATIPSRSGNLADESARGQVSNYIPRYNDGEARLSDTGNFRPNAVGIHDLVGNVSEWTHDSYSHTAPSGNQIETDPFDSSTTSYRTVKGSNWQSASLGELRAAYRRVGSSGSDTVGIRVARYLN